MPSPVPGRDWRTLDSTKVSINDRRDHVLSGTLNGSIDDNYLIVKNGQKFAQSGDVLPSLSQAPVGTGLAAPIVVSNTGDVYWGPRFNDANDESFARNYEPIVKRGQVLPEGMLVESIPAAANGFAVSPNGRFFVGRVELQGIGSAVVCADFGLVLELPGCAGNAGTLELESGMALVGGRFSLALDHAQVAGAIPALTFSTRAASESSECGLPTPFGEVLLSPPSIRKTLKKCITTHNRTLKPELARHNTIIAAACVTRTLMEIGSSWRISSRCRYVLRPPAEQPVTSS
jgi:hypothetical protein